MGRGAYSPQRSGLLFGRSSRPVKEIDPEALLSPLERLLLAVRHGKPDVALTLALRIIRDGKSFEMVGALAGMPVKSPSAWVDFGRGVTSELLEQDEWQIPIFADVDRALRVIVRLSSNHQLRTQADQIRASVMTKLAGQRLVFDMFVPPPDKFRTSEKIISKGNHHANETAVGFLAPLIANNHHNMDRYHTFPSLTKSDEWRFVARVFLREGFTDEELSRMAVSRVATS
jgi:hypothetical protein